MVSWGLSTIPTCLVEGLMSRRDYTLAHFMTLGMRGRTLVVLVILLSAVEAAVSHWLVGGFVFPPY